MRRFGVLLSGGMDSAVLLWKVAVEEKSPSKFFIFQFDYGSAHAKKELYASDQIVNIAKEHFPKHTFSVHRIKLPFSGWGVESGLLETQKDIPDGHYEEVSMRKTIVPFRNAVMLSIACSILKKGSLFYGSHAGDHAIYPDCRQTFVDAMRLAISEGTASEISLESPFVSLSKRDIGLLGKALNVPLDETWSCYKGGESHCGTCGTCVERKEALAGFDYTTYNA